jgi:DNA-binding CsgD family transcriptional regulator
MSDTPPPPTPANDLARIGDVLVALFARAPGAPLQEWERDVVRTLAALAGAAEVVLFLRGGQTVGPFAAGVSAEMVRDALQAPNAVPVPDGNGHAPYRTFVWCRPAAAPTSAERVPRGFHEPVATEVTDDLAYEAVGLAAELGLPGVFAMAVCRFSSHRDGGETRERFERLRSLLPAFAAAARLRTSATGTRRLAARLLEASGASVLLFTADGDLLYGTTALARLLGGDPDRDLVREEIESLAREFLAERLRAPAEDGDDDRGDDGALATDSRTVETRHGRYLLRCCEIPADAPGQPALVATTLEVTATTAAGADLLASATATLRARYGLTTRELDVARLLMAGRPNVEVAQQLGISEFTARRHTEHVLEKLGVRSRAEVPAVLHALLAQRPPARDA